MMVTHKRVMTNRLTDADQVRTESVWQRRCGKVHFANAISVLQ